MHKDESREETHHHDLVTSEVLSDTENLYTHYSVRVDLAEHLRARVAEPQRTLSQSREQLNKQAPAAANFLRLTRQLGSATVSPKLYRPKTQRLDTYPTGLRTLLGLRSSCALPEPTTRVGNLPLSSPQKMHHYSSHPIPELLATLYGKGRHR